MATYNPTNTGSGIGTGEAARTASESMGPGKPGDDKAGGVTGAIGNRLDRAGDYLDEKGKAAFVSERLHSAGRYLQEHDARSMARSVDEAICAHPYRSMLLGLGIGWVIGKFLSR